MVEFKINNYLEHINNNGWRNKFHFDSPKGLINDPNGLSYFNGEYYIFFQWNPYSCKHENKNWGLTRTRDFINFSKPKIILKPNDYYDKNGCYSGCAISNNGELEIFYTGNVKDSFGERKSYQCRAILNKDNNLKKIGPVIDKKEDGYTEHFRDPYIFERDDEYYMILGIQTINKKGRCVIYKSHNLESWSFLGELKTKFVEFGFMWECPSLISIGDNDVFIFSPQGLEKEEFKYQNIYQSGYVIGKLDLDEISFDGDEFCELDKGFDFYAPQVFKDDKGRNILIGWMGLPEEEYNHKSIEDGWVYSLTIPRELTIRENKLYQNPINEMKNYRGNKLYNIENLNGNNFSFKIDENSYELDLQIKNNDSEKLYIKFMLDKDEYSYIEYNFKLGIVTLDKSKMDYTDCARRFKLDKPSVFRINMFVDKSSVEIYFQDGQEVASLKLYPKKENTNLAIESNGGDILIEKLKIWNLKEMRYYE